MDSFDALVDDSTAGTPAQQMQSIAPPAPEANAAPAGFDDLVDDNEKYGTLGQQALAGVEGLGRGVLGPLAPAIEVASGHTTREAIRGRQEANPFTHGAGEAVGLVGGALTGTGEAAVLGKAGEAATELAGLANLAKDASYGSKVGSAVARQAAEMAVLQGSDETSKMILQDPNTSAESAIANIGLAAALGGAGGAFMTGAVNPLWEATAGPKVEQFLNGIKSHINGEAKLVLPGELEDAQKLLGIELSPYTRAGMSGDPKAANIFNELREAQKPQIMADIKHMKEQASKSVMDSLKVAPEDIANYSENQAGHDLIDTFKQEYDEKFAPIQKQYDALKEQNTSINIPDEERLKQFSKIIERGQAFGAAGSPQQKIFNEYGERLLAQDTIGHTDKLITEINNELKKAYRAGDNNTAMAFKEIKSSIQDFQDQQIGRAAQELATTPEERLLAKAQGKDFSAERTNASVNYAKIAKISDEMSQQMGLGEFRGYKNLLTKLAEKKSPEQVLRSLSPKGNADIIPFLQEHFPATLARIQDNEAKNLIRPAILAAKGDESINLKVLNNAVEKGLAGNKEHVKFTLPNGALEKIQAANKIINALPEMKSSGTAGWQQKLNRYMPASAGAVVSMLMGGHGPLGWMMGHMGELLGKDAPEAVKLAYLKFLASDQPINAKGFKSLVDFIHATQKGETLLAKAATNVFKPGVQVLTDRQMPVKADLIKLDKLVAKNQAQPQAFMNAQNGHVGHYASDQQAALTQTSATAMQYLQGLKPHPYKPNPLDKEIKPSPAEEARYNRALEIAQQPAVVLQHVKDGTVQITDLRDLKAMYPAYYARAAQKLTNEMIGRHADEEIIPYKTRVGVSLFLGQPLDASMKPSSIIAAQPKPRQPVQQPSQQGNGKPKSMNSLGKNTKSYQTPDQSSESRRVNHD